MATAKARFEFLRGDQPGGEPPIVQKFYAAKKIDITGGVYDLAMGKIALV